MSEYQNLEKNRIRCEAKIRNKEPQLTHQKHLLTENTSNPIISIKNPKLVNSIATPLSVYLTEETKQFSPTEPEYFVGASKVFSNQLQLTKYSGKHWEESEIRWDNEEVESLVSKEDFTKRSEITDYTQFDRNITPLIYGDCDSSFDQKILSNDHFDMSSKQQARSSRNVAYLERTLEYKNVQFINVLVTKNEEKKVLEKKIFDLEFQMFIEKRNSDRAINTIAISLKNAQGLCETQQIQIKRLAEELKLSQQLRHKVETSYEQRISELFQNIGSLEITCDQLRKEVQESTLHLQTLKLQKAQLEGIIEEVKEQRLNFQKIESLKEKFANNFETTMSNLTVDQVEQIDGEESGEQHNSENNGDSQQSVESQVVYLQNIIKGYERQLVENRRKMKQQKKIIGSLQIKLQELQGASLSLQAVNTILSQVNEEMVILQLSKLNFSFQ